MTNENWFENCQEDLKNKFLNQILIPGTHNSATYCIDNYSEYSCDAPSFLLGNSIISFLGRFVSKSIVKNYAICQNKSITQQLKDGIRYIDLRVCESEDDLGHICHSLKAGDLKGILKEISTFLKFHTKEIVILDIKRLIGFQDKKKWIVNFVEFCKQEFKGLLIPLNVKDLKIQTLWDNGYQLLIFIPSDNIPVEFWSRNYIENAWADSTDPLNVIQYVKTHKSNRKKEIFHISEYIITPDHDLIKNNIFSSLEIINSSFVPLIHKNLINDQENFNIITCDFYDENFISICVKINKINK